MSRLNTSTLDILPFDKDDDSLAPRTARTIYKLLRKLYGVYDYISSSALYFELCNLQCGSHVLEYVTKWRGGIAQLRAAKFIFSFRMVIEQFLDRLPSSIPYDILRFHTMKTIDDISVDDITAFIKLTDEVLRIDNTYRRTSFSAHSLDTVPDVSPSPPLSSTLTTKISSQQHSSHSCSNCSTVGHTADKCFKAGGGLEGKRDRYLASRHRVQAHLAHLMEILEGNVVDESDPPFEPDIIVPSPVISLPTSPSTSFTGLSYPHSQAILTSSNLLSHTPRATLAMSWPFPTVQAVLPTHVSTTGDQDYSDFVATTETTLDLDTIKVTHQIPHPPCYHSSSTAHNSTTKPSIPNPTLDIPVKPLAGVPPTASGDSGPSKTCTHCCMRGHLADPGFKPGNSMEGQHDEFKDSEGRDCAVAMFVASLDNCKAELVEPHDDEAVNVIAAGSSSEGLINEGTTEISTMRDSTEPSGLSLSTIPAPNLPPVPTPLILRQDLTRSVNLATPSMEVGNDDVEGPSQEPIPLPSSPAPKSAAPIPTSTLPVPPTMKDVPHTTQSAPHPVVSMHASSSPPLASLSFYPHAFLTSPHFLSHVQNPTTTSSASQLSSPSESISFKEHMEDPIACERQDIQAFHTNLKEAYQGHLLRPSCTFPRLKPNMQITTSLKS